MGSTVGMQTSVETSALLKVRAAGRGGPVQSGRASPAAQPGNLSLQFRAEAVVPTRMREMARCVLERDFQAFAQLTMKDSNQFHATCLDTFPPISYLNDTSRRIIHLVHRFNAHHGQTKVGQPHASSRPPPAPGPAGQPGHLP